MCFDWRSLNKKTKAFASSIPALDTVVSRIGGNRIYTSLDLTKGYMQVRIRKADRFKKLLEGLESLERVLERLRCGGLKISPTKCNLMKSKVFFLGAWISKAGYEADKNKVKVIVNLPFPSTKKKLMSWLGMINWFRPLLKNAAAELKPMSDLLTGSNTKIIPNKEAVTSFENMKKKLTTMPILVMPNKDKQFFLWCDASFSGLGAALTQEYENGEGQKVYKPVSYSSRVLTVAEQKWPSFKLEMRAIMLVKSKYDHLLYGSPKPFVVFTEP